MDLTDREIRELALFFAKRMDTSLNLLDPTDPPPPGDPRKQWIDKLTDARDRGDVQHLVKRISRLSADDENLQGACQILLTPGANLDSWAIGAAFVAGTGILLVSIAAAAGILAAAAIVGETEKVVEISPAPKNVYVAAEVVVPAAEVEMEISYDEPEITVEEPIGAAPTRSVSRSTFQRCNTSSGEIVGYWYAGSQAPGAPGQTVTVGHAINVRADYPDVHNNFDARSNITCVLQEGDVVRLSRDPILVPADRYWIPLVSGDLVSS